MAKIDFSTSDKYGRVLGYWETRILDDAALKRVVRRGAAIIADALRMAIDALREREKGSNAAGVTKREKELLTKHFGITPIKRDRDGFLHAKIGWDGYSGSRTKQHPQGVPIPLVARVIESGTSWREKLPFVRKTVKKYELPAIEEMQKALDEELEDIFNFEGRT